MTKPTHPIAQLLLDARCQVGESLIWCPTLQALFWVDITGKQLHRYVIHKQTHTVWPTPEMVGCIALSASSVSAPNANTKESITLVAGMESGIFDVTFTAQDAPLFSKRVDAPHSAPYMRFNDGRCDRQGRFIAGTMMANQTVGEGNPSIYRYNNGKLTLLLSAFVKPFTTPNGMAFSPNGRTFYLSDSHASQQRVWAFDYDIDTGTPHNRREFIDMNLHSGRPDGAAIDTDGCYWICATDAGMIHRFTPQGKLDYSLTVPVKKPTICTFGGADLKTLYVASIRSSGDVSDQPLAGGVFAFEGLGALGVQGIAEAPFGG